MSAKTKKNYCYYIKVSHELVAKGITEFTIRLYKYEDKYLKTKKEFYDDVDKQKAIKVPLKVDKILMTDKEIALNYFGAGGSQWRVVRDDLWDVMKDANPEIEIPDGWLDRFSCEWEDFISDEVEEMMKSGKQYDWMKGDWNTIHTREKRKTKAYLKKIKN